MHFPGFPLTFSGSSILGLCALAPFLSSVIATAIDLEHRATYNFPYQNPQLPTNVRVEDLLSRMSFLEQLAQTRASSSGLGANSSYDLASMLAQNAPYGIGSICKSNHLLYHCRVFLG